MSHNLTITNGKAEMFSGSNIVPWHGLGTVVNGLLTSSEAIKAAGLDWNVRKLPIFAGKENEQGDKIFNEIPDFYRMAREDNDLTLSIVGKRYHAIQNTDAFDFFDNVVGSKQAIYDTAGSLNGGRKVWMMAKMKGSFFIRKNDNIEKYVLLVTTHDGTGSLTMQLVTVRVVCQNTLSASLSGAINKISIRHTPNYQAKIDAAARVLGIAQKYFTSFESFMKILDKKAMTVKGAEKFVQDLIPFQEGREDSTRTLNIHNKILELFETGAGNLGKTKWCALNAVTHWVDHNRSTRVGKGVNEKEKRFESSVLGNGAVLKQKAVDLLLA